VLQPEIGPLDGAPALIEAHAMDPLKVLCTATAMGAKPEQVFIVGCEPRTMPADFDEGDTAMGMSPPVFAALDEAVRLVESLVQRIQDQFTSQPSPPKETHTWAH
jgi:hypothetical protein